jgi:hypothetical protein
VRQWAGEMVIARLAFYAVRAATVGRGKHSSTAIEAVSCVVGAEGYMTTVTDSFK